MGHSPELMIACGSDDVMAWKMSIKGGHFVWMPLAKLESRKFVKHQQEKKTMWSTCQERRPCEAPEGEENPVKHQQEKKTLQSLFAVFF